ncbi:transcription initiation factor TFIID subunit 12 [Scaptodrosophila lebanonensis]|uniref:Transcription initiation factor TFIID subunit 12 n=1 Tax=Drosophila lebanonensis TaxID=7225 RepID=A0A6J2T925_DROLE|nr:transcription initiation factor TFIID subunit 12 [Scaptodrosophila lebanonensis]
MDNIQPPPPFRVFGDDELSSSSEERNYSSSLTSSLSDSSSSSHDTDDEDEERFYSFGNEYDIITRPNLDRFVQECDENAVLDDQAADLIMKLADAFVEDVSMRVVKLAKYRNDELSALDVKFILKREYNIEFPHNPNEGKEFKK